MSLRRIHRDVTNGPACNNLPAIIAQIVPRNFLYNALNDVGDTNIALQNIVRRN